MLPDDIILPPEKGVIKSIDAMKFHTADACIGVKKIIDEQISDYGTIKANKLANNIFGVNWICEKMPKEKAPSNLGIIGRYIFNDNIFNALENTDRHSDGELRLADAINILLRNNSIKIVANQCEGEHYDIGTFEEWWDANNSLLGNS